jgi:hypothetical protein
VAAETVLDGAELGEARAEAQLIPHGGEQSGSIHRFGNEVRHPGAHRALLEAREVVALKATIGMFLNCSRARMFSARQ